MKKEFEETSHQFLTWRKESVGKAWCVRENF